MIIYNENGTTLQNVRPLVESLIINIIIYNQW